MHRPGILQAVIEKSATARSGSRLIEIAVHDLGRIPLALQRAANRLGQRHGAVPPARATERDRQKTFALPDIVRDQISQKTFDAAQELSGLRKRANVTRDARILAAERAEARNEVRIRKEAHVENQVRVGGNSVAKSETDDRDQEWPPPRALKAVDDELAQLVNVEFCRVDDDVGETADRGHAPPLLANSLGDGDFLAERMGAAGFAEAAQQSALARFDEDERGGAFAAQLAVNSRQLVNVSAFAGVHQQGHALHFAASALIEFAERGNQSDGEIIHEVEAEVL